MRYVMVVVMGTETYTVVREYGALELVSGTKGDSLTPIEVAYMLEGLEDDSRVTKITLTP